MATPALNLESGPTAREAYDKWHDSFLTDPEANSPWYRLLKQHLRHVDLTRKRILEIGCGRGDFACWMARELGDRAEIYGADFSPAAVCKAKLYAESHQLVGELVRVLKPGGLLFVSIPNYLGLIGLYRGYLRVMARPFTEVGQPINHFTVLPRTLRWMRSAGLAITAVDATGHYLPFPGRPPVEMRFLDNPRWLMRWTGLHSLVMAKK